MRQDPWKRALHPDERHRSWTRRALASALSRSRALWVHTRHVMKPSARLLWRRRQKARSNDVTLARASAARETHAPHAWATRRLIGSSRTLDKTAAPRRMAVALAECRTVWHRHLCGLRSGRVALHRAGTHDRNPWAPLLHRRLVAFSKKKLRHLS